MNEPRKSRAMPKGGRKGGVVFPRTALKEAIAYSNKLVSKSHVSRISRDILFSGVLGAKSGIGNTRASAIKQFGLMIGDTKDGFGASDLAKKIAASPENEVAPLRQQAALAPSVFKKIFDTYHGDAVTRAKLKQRAADLNVHPEETETCVDLYVRSMEFAGLVSVEGDKISHVHNGQSAVVVEKEQEQEQEQNGDEAIEEGEESAEEVELPAADGVADEPGANAFPSRRSTSAPKSVIHINVSLDSTTDSEKLAKQLALLRRYGAL